MRKNLGSNTLWFLLIFIFIIALNVYLFAPSKTELSYSHFLELLKADAIQDVIIGDREITAKVNPNKLNITTLPKEKISQLIQPGSQQYLMTTASLNSPNLIPALEEKNINFSFKKNNVWYTLLITWIIPLLLFVLFVSFFIRRSSIQSTMGIEKSKAKIYKETETHITFKDVAGIDEAKAELFEVVQFLKNPDFFNRLGAHIPKGVLLFGAPGTGKTLLARAIAGEACVPFFSINGSEFVELFVGVGAARVRSLFEEARNCAPAIIFIDEIDALGRARGAYGLSSSDEKEQTLNQLLSEMDGFDPQTNLIILAATNRPEILDPALLRAGRFDRQILLDLPDKVGRIQILSVHLKKIKTSPKLDIEKIADLTPGFSGADLANLINEATLCATRRHADSVNEQDFTIALERIIAGIAKTHHLMNPFEKRCIAYHEMGHALVSTALLGLHSVQKISIIPRGIKGLGYTLQRPTEDRYLMTQQELQDKLTILLAGRAAEYVIFQHYSTGAMDDLARGADIARSMIMKYGMDETLGHVAYDKDHSLLYNTPTSHLNFRPELSENTAHLIDEGIRTITKEAFDNAVAIIQKYKTILKEGAELLLEKETLDEKELLVVFKQVVQLKER